MADAGLSAAELGRRSGFDGSVVSRWLDGKSTPSIANLRQLAPVLGVPLLRLVVLAGHLTADEAQMAEKMPTMGREYVRQTLRAEFAERPELLPLVLSVVQSAWEQLDRGAAPAVPPADELRQAAVQRVVERKTRGRKAPTNGPQS